MSALLCSEFQNSDMNSGCMQCIAVLSCDCQYSHLQNIKQDAEL